MISFAAAHHPDLSTSDDAHVGNTMRWMTLINKFMYHHIDVLVQDYSNSIAHAMELLQFCTKSSIDINPDWRQEEGEVRSVAYVAQTSVQIAVGHGKVSKWIRNGI